MARHQGARIPGLCMKLLDRYLIREMLVPLIIGTLAIVMLFQANILIALYKDYQLSGVPAQAIFQFILFKTPQFMQMTLPIGMALASSLAMSRINRESELTAVRMAGVPILRVLMPVLVFGLLLSGLNFWVTERVMPESERQSRRILNSIGVLAVMSPQFRSDQVMKLRSYVVSIGSAHTEKKDTIELQDILLIERRGETTMIVDAKKGKYEDGVWSFYQPRTLQVKGTQVIGMEGDPAKPAKPLTINERISVPDFFMAAQVEEQTLEELREIIDSAKRTGRDVRWVEVNYHTKFSVPASCLIFALTGPAMAILLSRRGAFAGVLLSLGVVLAYYNMHVVSTSIFGRNGWVSPILAAWLPSIILAVIGIAVVRRLE